MPYMSGQELMRESRESGAVAFIVKPGTYSELRQKLASLLGGEEFHQRNV